LKDDESVHLFIFVLLSISAFSLSVHSMSQDFQNEGPELETPAPGALDPLQPGKPLGGVLRAQPDPESSAIRDIRPDDQVTILRSEGEWYEVDVVNPHGLLFRGWVRGRISEERAAPPRPERAAEPERQRPMDYFVDPDWRWFWDGKMDHAFELRLGFGVQGLWTDWAVQPAQEDSSPPSNRLNGMSLTGAGKLSVLQFDAAPGTWTSGLQFDYHFGFFQLNFASVSSIPEDLRGVGYQVKSHRLQANAFQSLKRPLSESWTGEYSAGLGIFYVESAPDLKNSQVADGFVFTQLSAFSPLLRLGAEFSRKESLRLGLHTGILLPSWSESPSQSVNPLKRSGIPLWFQAHADYSFTPTWAVFLSLDALNLKASQEESTRLGVAYDQVQLNFSQFLLNVGLVFRI